MNIEIANRLVQLRKKNGYSQEALAEKLGLSRQAVSKWERAEASPDTDNLIALAKLYNISLDELLRVDSGEGEEEAAPKQAGEKANVSFKHGIHVIDGDEEVHVSLGRVYVKTNGQGKIFDKDHIFTAGKDDPPRSRWLTMPYPFLVIAAFFGLGFGLDAWHPGWMVFLTIPIYYTLLDAIFKRAPHHFAWPVFTALVYLCLGFFCGGWAWGWLVFLTVPIYYCIFPGEKEKRE